MKKDRSILAVSIALALFSTIFFHFDGACAGEDRKFAQYRTAIKEEYGIDIRDFKGRLAGGKADGQKITKYDLTQLLMGIKVELEHTGDRMTALEISMDHLEEFDDYYTRLARMEKEAEHEKESREKAGKGDE